MNVAWIYFVALLHTVKFYVITVLKQSCEISVIIITILHKETVAKGVGVTYPAGDWAEIPSEAFHVSSSFLVMSILE